MSTTRQYENQVSSYLQEGPADLPLEQRVAIARATEQIAQRPTGIDWSGLARSRWLRVALAAGVVIVATALLAPRLDLPGVGGPRPTPEPTPLRWTQDSLRDPYPAPIREEPAEGAGVVDARLLPAAAGERLVRGWTDATGDARPSDESIVDLVNVEFWRGQGCLRVGQLCVYYRPARLLERPLPDPQVEWIAYGMVMDIDLDGRPDGRFGIDNGPDGVIRAWHTDLRTGTTQAVVGGNGKTYDGFYGESELPFSTGTTQPARGYMWLGQGLTAGPPELNGQFYLWAAVIRDGRIVSMDFAPDAGWLQPVPDPGWF